MTASADPVDPAPRADRARQADRAERGDPAEPVPSAERAGRADPAEPNASPDPAVRADPSDRSDPAERDSPAVAAAPADPAAIGPPALRSLGVSGAFIGAALILLAGLILTLTGMLWNRQRVVIEAQQLLDAHVERLERDVVQRLIQPVYGLKGARGTAAALDGRLDRHNFRAYVQSRDLPTEFPGVRGFGFAPRVARSALDEFVAAQQRDGAHDFHVRTSGQAADLYPVTYLEPLVDNLPAWGFDLNSEQVRHEAIEQAIATGEATLSAPVRLLQDRSNGPGLLLLVPVFRPGTDPTLPAQRRQALIGLLYAPLVATEILAGLKDRVAAPMDFRLLVSNADGHEDLLMESDTGVQRFATAPSARPGYETRVVVSEDRWRVGQRGFRLEAALSRDYERHVIDPAGWGLGLAGLVLTLLLSTTAYLLLAGRARAQALADAMTADLRRVTLDQEAMLDADILGIAKLRNRTVVWRNRALARLLGYSPEEMLGMPVREFYLSDEDFQALGERAYPVLRRGGHYRTQLQMRRKDGSPVWIDLNGVALPGAPDEELSLWMMVDITQSKDYERRVEQAAFHDGLTGLPNRLLLMDRLRQGVHAAQRQGSSLAVAFLDLDGFKAVNDTHGHEAGDEVLQAVARRLTGGLRATDTAARLGGDEFVVVLIPGAEGDDVRQVVERLLTAILAPVKLSTGVVVQVGSSIGVARYPADARDAEGLLSRADQAMFDSKRLGRCRIRLLQGTRPPVDVDLSSLRRPAGPADAGR